MKCIIIVILMTALGYDTYPIAIANPDPNVYDLVNFGNNIGDRVGGVVGRTVGLGLDTVSQLGGGILGLGAGLVNGVGLGLSSGLLSTLGLLGLGHRESGGVNVYSGPGLYNAEINLPYDHNSYDRFPSYTYNSVIGEGASNRLRNEYVHGSRFNTGARGQSQYVRYDRDNVYNGHDSNPNRFSYNTNNRELGAEFGLGDKNVHNEGFNGGYRDDRLKKVLAHTYNPNSFSNNNNAGLKQDSATGVGGILGANHADVQSESDATHGTGANDGYVVEDGVKARDKPHIEFGAGSDVGLEAGDNNKVETVTHSKLGARNDIGADNTLDGVSLKTSTGIEAAVGSSAGAENKAESVSGFTNEGDVVIGTGHNAQVDAVTGS